MKLFTFIADYKGGTYISQFMEETLENALLLWTININFLTNKDLESFKKELDYGDVDPPIGLQGLINTWCTCFTVSNKLLLLNIVETVLPN